MGQTSELGNLPVPLVLHQGARRLQLPGASLALLRVAPEVFVGAHLRAAVSFEAWQVLEREGLFHLDPEVRGPMLRPFAADRGGVELELALRPDLLEQLVLYPDSDVYDAIGVLLAADDDHPLVALDSWYARSAAQRDPTDGIADGFRTRWADPDTLAGVIPR